ncbi:hypothetical protein [Pseudonocardia endophytica]|uniref:Uncharacterized protein n=1 Tax=Pseudonocardia endophytica TaxID=401976 RepID=A0A4R1HPR8_PSEEN|nr:hypothetical protein [Pseudonocardia endophytica]TCK24554.1 hypothetical protein EV378_0328 [Pseudonocardia endophytica]
MTEQPGADGRRPDGSYPAPPQGGRYPAGPQQGPPGYGPPQGPPGYGPPGYGPPHHGSAPPHGDPRYAAPQYGNQQYGAPPQGAGYGQGTPGQVPPRGASGPAGPHQGARADAPAPGQAPPSGGFAYGPPPGQAPPNAAGSPPPPLQKPPKKKGKGGRIALIVVGVVLVVLVGGGYLAYRALSGFVSDVTGGTSLAGAGAGCSFVTADDVNGTLGGNYDLVELGGLGGLAGAALDSRVLADAPTCWGSDSSDGKLVRIARYEGGDAAQRFAAEKQTAQGSSQDQGNGVSVSTEGYLGEEIQAGDEAFCTTGDGTASAGALVRTGDKLVYVSTTAAGQGAESVPQIDLSGDKPGFATDGENCRLSAAVAATVN